MRRFKRILCIASALDASKAALQRALTLAESNQANLTLVAIAPHSLNRTGLPDLGRSPGDPQVSGKTGLPQDLREIIAPYHERVSIEIAVVGVISFLEIIRDVLRNERDLVIKAPEPSGLQDRLFGSDDMQLLRKCPCPLWLVKANAPKSCRRVIAAVDVGDKYPETEIPTRWALSRDVLCLASSVALADFAQLHVASAWEAMGESMLGGALIRTPITKLSIYVEEVRQRHQCNLDRLIDEASHYLGQGMLEYLKPQLHLIKGRPRRVIPHIVQTLGADLVVMGTVARTGASGILMGNTAESILNQIDCSVLAVKPAGFVTPVTLKD